MARRNNGSQRGLVHLRNIDYTDRELLFVVADVAGEHGARASDVAVQLGFEPDGRGRQAVAIRLSWMVRYGYLDRIDPREQADGKAGDPVAWVVTPLGRSLMSGRLSKTVQDQIGRMEPGAYILLMRQLGQQAFLESSDGVATAVRREYQHQYARRTL